MLSSFHAVVVVLGLNIHSHVHASCNQAQYHPIWVLLKQIDSCVEISLGMMCAGFTQAQQHINTLDAHNHRLCF